MSYSCDICLRSFKKCGNLTMHLRAHKNITEPEVKYPCEKYEKCCAVFRTEENLRLHEKIHEINYVCDICGIRIYRKWNFEHHMRTKHL